MFGYVLVNPQALSDAERQRFRGFYAMRSGTGMAIWAAWR